VFMAFSRVIFWEWRSMVIIVTIPPPGWSGDRILFGTKDFSVQNV